MLTVSSKYLVLSCRRTKMVLYSFMILLCRAQLLAEYGLKSSEWSVGFPCPVTEAHLSREEDKGKKKKKRTWHWEKCHRKSPWWKWCVDASISPKWFCRYSFHFRRKQLIKNHVNKDVTIHIKWHFALCCTIPIFSKNSVSRCKGDIFCPLSHRLPAPTPYPPSWDSKSSEKTTTCTRLPPTLWTTTQQLRFISLQATAEITSLPG